MLSTLSLVAPSKHARLLLCPFSVFSLHSKKTRNLLVGKHVTRVQRPCSEGGQPACVWLLSYLLAQLTFPVQRSADRQQPEHLCPPKRANNKARSCTAVANSL